MADDTTGVLGRAIIGECPPSPPFLYRDPARSVSYVVSSTIAANRFEREAHVG